MKTTRQLPSIALISFHGDPYAEIGMEAAGGQNVYVRRVGEALAQQGWTVDLLTRKTSPEQPDLVSYSGCQVIRFVSGPQTFIPQNQLLPHLEEFVQKILSKRGKSFYSLVHTNYWLEGWIGMKLRNYQMFKQVHTNHSLGISKYKVMSSSDIPTIAKTRLSIEKLCLESADRIVATSPQEKEVLRTISPLGNIDIIPCGTDTQLFGSVSRSEARKHLSIDENAKVVLYVGRFDPLKGIEILIRAISQYICHTQQNLQLIIVGGNRLGQADGREYQRISNIVQELAIENITTFTGHLPQEALPSYYSAADVCVVPSYYESFGLVALEAMASGTPVIASNVGGLQFTVTNEVTGLLVPPKNISALAEAINRILNNPEFRNQLGKAGYQKVREKFTWHQITKQLSNLYQSLLEISN